MAASRPVDRLGPADTKVTIDPMQPQDNKTVAEYAVPCGCGRAVAVTGAHAGSTRSCPGCGMPVSIPSLSMMRKLPPVRHNRRSGPFQYGLGDLFLLTSGLAAVFAFVSTAGSRLAFGIVVVTFLFASPYLLYCLTYQVLCAFWDWRDRWQSDDGSKWAGS